MNRCSPEFATVLLLTRLLAFAWMLMIQILDLEIQKEIAAHEIPRYKAY
jgi:hypothetical protein